MDGGELTVSSSTAREITIGEVWLGAAHLAGLIEASQSLQNKHKVMCKRYSEGLVDELATYGVSARQRTFDTLTLTTGTGYPYSFAATTLDVVGDGMCIKANVTDITEAPSETPVIQVDQEAWHRISAKSATGTPAVFFVNRVANTLTARYWPIPSEAFRVRHIVQRHLADMNDENATMDLETFWMQYFMWSLAHQLAEASSMPGTKVDRLERTAQRKLGKARGFANPHTGNQIILDHEVA